MKRLFIAAGILALLFAGAGIVISLVQHETLMEILAKQLGTLSFATLTIASGAGLGAMKEDVYGGWKLEIFISGRYLGSERQAIRSVKVEEIINCSHGWVWKFFQWGIFEFILDDPFEDLLRKRFESQGRILGNPFDFVTFSPNQPKTIWLDVPEDRFVPAKKD